MHPPALRLGFVGAGFQARNLATAAASLSGLSVIGFYSRTQDTAREAAGRFAAHAWSDVSEVHEAKLDLLVVASANSAHAEHLRTFSDAAPVIFVEKPAVTSEADLDIAQTLADAGRLVVGHVLRTAPGLGTMLQQVRRGDIGPVRDLASCRAQLLAPPSGWKADPLQTGGLLVHEIHELDLLCLAGGEVSEARSYQLGEGNGPPIGAHVIIRFDTGAVATHRIMTRSHRPEWYLQLNGELGALRADFLRATVSLIKGGIIVDEWPILSNAAANSSLRGAGQQRSHNATATAPAPWMSDLARGEMLALARIVRGQGSLLQEAPLRAAKVALSLRQPDPRPHAA